MTTLVLRNTTPTENRRLPSSFHTYVAIDKDLGGKIADIKHAYRPKNAGGSAWQANVINPEHHAFPNETVTVYSKDLRKLCEIIRYLWTREGSPPSHWR